MLVSCPAVWAGSAPVMVTSVPGFTSVEGLTVIPSSGCGVGAAKVMGMNWSRVVLLPKVWARRMKMPHWSVALALGESTLTLDDIVATVKYVAAAHAGH